MRELDCGIRFTESDKSQDFLSHKKTASYETALKNHMLYTKILFS